MKPKFLTAIAITAMAIVSCSVDTDTIGSSLTNETDKLEFSTRSFQAFSRSVLVDSVYARNYETYFGKVKDPETGTYVKTEFMAQFNMQEDVKLPSLSQMLSKDEEGKILADSCEIWLLFDKSSSYGDSLTPLKMNILELDRPMSDTYTYYSNYDPKAEGYIRDGGLKKSIAFSMNNLTYIDSIRNLSSYAELVRVSLSDPYTDKNGATYNNYGTYLLRNYYEHPEYFKNSYSFIHSVCPGFYFELGDGLGLMAKFKEMHLRTYFHYQSDTTRYVSFLGSASTPEVLQTTKVTNDKEALRRLVNDESCTYLKSPSGIFTEVTLPVDEITQNHANDSLLTVSISFSRENSNVSSPYLLNAPSTIMMLPTDSLRTFFEEEKSYDYNSSFVVTLSKNCYEFSNISNLITLMSKNKAKGLASDPDWVSKHLNWNKVLLVPVSITTSTTSSGTTVAAVISNQMGLVSTKLVGGPSNPIEMKVIYAKFHEN